MNVTACKFAAAFGFFWALLGASQHGLAAPVGPGDTFNIAYDMTVGHPPGSVYTHVTWQLVFSDGGFFQPGQSINFEAYDSSNSLLGSQSITQGFVFPIDNISAGFFTLATVDPIGFLKVTSLNAVFDLAGGNALLDATSILSNAVVITPLPAALPLFVSGLGVLGLITWRRKRPGTQASV